MKTFITRVSAQLVAPIHADEGQATTEYALVLLGAALIALLMIGWATTGGGSGKIGELFDGVIEKVIGKL